MDIYPKDSDGTLKENNIPDETSTELRTNVVVKDGQTVVIGGLFRDSVTVSKSQVPVLGSVPIVGALFRGNTIGFIFQDFNLLPVLTVYENIEYPLLMVRETPAAERRDRVMSLIEAVGMSEQRDKYPDQLSGGQKQRVAVARALVTNPKLVLADEPTANLDHQTAYRVIELMKKMRDEFATTFIFSTHDPKIVGEAEIIYTLEDGLLKNSNNQGGVHHG